MAKKILFVVPALGIGGAEKSFISFVNALTRRSGNELMVIVLSHVSEHQLKKLHHSIQIKILNRKSTSRPGTLLSVYWNCRRFRPDILIGWSTYAIFVVLVIAPFFKKAKIIISERNYIPKIFSLDNVGKWRRRIVLYLMKKLYINAHVITANSFDNLRFLKKYIGSGPSYYLLKNTIDYDEVSNLRAKYIVARDPAVDVILVALGRLDYQKGFDVLLNAYYQAIEQNTKMKLYLIGSGDQGDSLKKLAKDLGIDGKICWISEVNNPYPYYDLADIVIVPSRFEGFPNVMMEAMACGKAVIASDCKTGPRELSANGKLAKLVPVGGVDEMKRAILSLADDVETRTLMGSQAALYIFSEYEKNIIVTNYIDLLDKIE